jgi:hypothetical protein
MQEGVCRFLSALSVHHPIIVDVGIGAGIPTILDLARALPSVGISTATIVGIDVNENVVKWGNLILQQMRNRSEIPSNIRIELRVGDILASDGSPLDVRSVVEGVCGNGVRAHLTLTSNLVNGFDPADSACAIASLRAATESKGLVVMGAGDSNTYLDVRVFDPKSGDPVGTYRLTFGEAHERFQADLMQLASDRRAADESSLQPLVAPSATSSW